MTSPFYADVLQCSQEGFLIETTKAAAVWWYRRHLSVICCVRGGGGICPHLPCPPHLICSVSAFVRSSFEDKCWWESVLGPFPGKSDPARHALY